MQLVVRVAIFLCVGALLGCRDPVPEPARPPDQAPDPALRQVRAPVAALHPAPDPEDLAVIERGLASSDYATRLVATEALGCARTSEAARWLEHQLGDPEPDVRAAAIEALHHHAAPHAWSLLRTVRDDTDEQLHLRVLAAYARLTPPPSCTWRIP